jgi:hypothetical protein
MPGVEYATKPAAGSSKYPRRWGMPEGAFDSEQRVAWVRERILEDRSRRRLHGSVAQALAQLSKRP